MNNNINKNRGECKACGGEYELVYNDLGEDSGLCQWCEEVKYGDYIF